MSKLYSPPSRNYPQELPDHWGFEDGTVRTDLQELSDVELEALGWHGPITMPEDIEGTSYYTHDYIWNSELLRFDAIEVSESEKRQRVNYSLFWSSLIGDSFTGVNLDENGEITYGQNVVGSPYKKIKDTAKVSLEANVLVTEFIALISDARFGDPNVEKIQESLSEIIREVPFSDEELSLIQKAFAESGMFAIYTLI